MLPLISIFTLKLFFAMGAVPIVKSLWRLELAKPHVPAPMLYKIATVADKPAPFLDKCTKNALKILQAKMYLARYYLALRK